MPYRYFCNILAVNITKRFAKSNGGDKSNKLLYVYQLAISNEK